MSDSPGKLVYFPSAHSQNGWRVEKWPTGFSNIPNTKISATEDAKLVPAKTYDIPEEDWERPLRVLEKKYPPPHEREGHKPRIAPNLKKNERDVQT